MPLAISCAQLRDTWYFGSGSYILVRTTRNPQPGARHERGQACEYDFTGCCTACITPTVRTYVVVRGFKTKYFGLVLLAAESVLTTFPLFPVPLLFKSRITSHGYEYNMTGGSLNATSFERSQPCVECDRQKKHRSRPCAKVMFASLGRALLVYIRV